MISLRRTLTAALATAHAMMAVAAPAPGLAGGEAAGRRIIVDDKRMSMSWTGSVPARVPAIPASPRTAPPRRPWADAPTSESAISPPALERFMQRLGLPMNRALRSGDDVTITLLAGDRVKLRVDETFSRWEAKADGAVRLFVDKEGIHTIVALREANPIFKTSFATGRYFVVTPNPWKLGVLSFQSTDEPKPLYAAHPGTRYIQPWAKIPYAGDEISDDVVARLLADVQTLGRRLGLTLDDYTVAIRMGQAIITLHAGAAVRVEPGTTFVCAQEGDIRLFMDPLTAMIGFHTMQIRRTSWPPFDPAEEETAEFKIWTYDAKRSLFTYYAVSDPKRVYTPMDYADDLFTPFEPAS